MTASSDRIRMFHNGYHPLPLRGKRPFREGWQNGFTLNDDFISDWEKHFPDAGNTGVLTAFTPFLDIDITDEEAAEACTLLVYERWDDIPCRVGASPKRGHPFRTDTPFAKITAELIAPNGKPHRIEFLGDGQQFVAFGIHPDTKRPYIWNGGSPLDIAHDHLPSISGHEAQALVDALVALLVHDYNYKPKSGPAPKDGYDDSSNGGDNWHRYLSNLINHDNDAQLAYALLVSERNDGAVVNMMRALIELFAGRSDPTRLQRRLNEVPDLVRSARNKIGPTPAARPTPGPQPSPPSQELDSAADLKGMVFMPLKWIVPGYIPEGVTLLAGKPKVGKSWLMLATALAASMARAVLGENCDKRNVLYCALEDTRRRMRSRIDAIIGQNDVWPDNLRFAYELPNLDQGGIAALQQMIDKYGAKVVIIDTLARFRGQKLKNEEQYQCDYRTMTALNDLAKKNDVAVIVVHHVRKQTAEDVFDTISGTMGLSGAADTLVILTRAEEELRLVVRGRDVEPEDKIVDFDIDTGTWSVTGDYEGKDGASASNARTLILSTLATAKYSMKPNDIAEKTGLSKSTTRGSLRRMQKAGEIQRTQYGTYEKPRVS
jgi:hypothetical protein